MRTLASLLPPFVAIATIGALAACSSDEAEKPGPESGGSSGTGNPSGGVTNGGNSTGGSTGTGGDGGTTSGGSATGGDGGAPSGGNTSGGRGGTAGEGGTSPTTGGNSSGGDAGMSGAAGNAGSTNGGSGGSGGGTPSAGCSAAGSPTSGSFMIDVGGTMREYIIKLPAAYDATRPYRLIFTFHGRMYSAQSVADGGPPGSGPYYGIEAVSGGSAIFVAPQALSTSWTNEGGRDVAYIEAMIARFKAELCIDESRIFSVGFSMGAIMTLIASCEDDSVFRAIAPMSASLPGDCDGNDRARAYWGSHGTEDPTISPAQGQAVRDSFVAKNGCMTTTMPGDREGCVNYQGCDAGAPVTWCTFSGVHEPPPYAGEAIWAFFSQF
jgi:poly(3-hydroxybutyrate) depolymerase